MMSLLDNFVLVAILATVVGAAVGSFLSMFTYRFPRALPMVADRSACTSCNAKLGVRDLFPIISYLMARGKCRHCGAPYSIRYLLIELASALAPLGLLYLYGPTWHFVVLCVLAWVLIAMIVIDLEHYIIPDQIQLILIGLALVYIYLTGQDWQDRFFAATIGWGAGLVLRYGFLWLRKKDGLGLGDVKFLGVVGLWLGPLSLVPYLAYAGGAGILHGLLWLMLGKGARFPFGPALAAAMFAMILFPQLSEWYWALYR